MAIETRRGERYTRGDVTLSSATRAVRSAAGTMLAAVDLGSNSFHMVIARETPAGLVILDRRRDRVQLAAGLDDRGLLSEEARERALACLRRFGQRLADLPAKRVRAVGTNTLRRTRDGGAFWAEASAALGHPIAILPGYEEGRLIYLGVAHDLTEPDARRLVVDIGGGSTECVIGEGLDPLEIDSLQIGCVSMSQAHFADGVINEARMSRAELAARREIETLAARYRRRGWDECVGSSGTIKATEAVLQARGKASYGITSEDLRWLRKQLLRAGAVEKLALPGLPRERASVLPGGLAILGAVFEGLGLASMHVSQGALREGVLFDLRGRIHDDDLREETIAELARRYHTDRRQAARVEGVALRLFDQVAPAWELERGRRLLAWAARIHEIGLAVAYGGHHRHGAYLVRHSNLPGFSRQEQQALSSLILGHRRKVARKAFEKLEPFGPELLMRLCALLRLAVLLCRSRKAAPRVRCDAEGGALHLCFDPGWLDAHPLTRADFEEEQPLLARLGVSLAFG
jgi:exopolyphosphatase / guanosine-5'-triphosphate,3'-diphosphate pyrophosphatase